jgi:hypothetical protein
MFIQGGFACFYQVLCGTINPKPLLILVILFLGRRDMKRIQKRTTNSGRKRKTQLEVINSLQIFKGKNTKGPVIT